MLLLLLTRSRNLFSLMSDTWNIIFHLLIMSLHSNFLLKSQKFLFGIREVRLNNFVSVSTTL